MMQVRATIRSGILLAVICGAVSGCGGQAAVPATPRPEAVGPVATLPSLTAGTIKVQMERIPSLLLATWQSYKVDFVQGDGRVVDHGRAGVSTSEGQSYAMLRAVWMSDRPAFDGVWGWTKRNLQVRRDHLFGFLWGKNATGHWTILSKNTATDADEDIALALVFASKRWNDRAYLDQARAVIRDIWNVDVAKISGRPFLTAGNWAPHGSPGGAAINPSYFAPYAYRIFARIDSGHVWQGVVDTSYSVLRQCSRYRLREKRSVGLPPNWCEVSDATAKVKASPALPHASLYGYDAFRSMWRIALDWQWNREPRAIAYLRSSAFLRETWLHTGKLYAQYHHDGRPVSRLQDPTIVGGDIGNFAVTASHTARVIAVSQLLSVLHQSGVLAYWDQRYNYYEQNWVWFGLGLVGKDLPNLANRA